jgi:hypothetical protein
LLKLSRAVRKQDQDVDDLVAGAFLTRFVYEYMVTIEALMRLIGEDDAADIARDALSRTLEATAPLQSPPEGAPEVIHRLGH